MVGKVTTSAGSRLVALVNPAWKSVADFGFFGAGEAKKAMSDFEVTYSLQSLVVYGYTVRSSAVQSSGMMVKNVASCIFSPFLFYFLPWLVQHAVQ